MPLPLASEARSVHSSPVAGAPAKRAQNATNVVALFREQLPKALWLLESAPELVPRTMAEKLTSGRTVWVQDPTLKDDKVFFKGTVKEDDGKQVTVLPEGGGAAAVWKKELVLLATTNTAGVKDHTMLDVLNEATLLDNTQQRFLTDSIQTYISEILIVTNPFKRIPGIYDEEVMKQYKGGNWNKLEPHVYATAEMAYTHMVTNTQSQSLLVAGESGAGKTECNKQLLNFLIWRAGASGAANASTLSKDILDTNPVLEAFGNAKTIRNNNSSRIAAGRKPARPVREQPMRPRGSPGCLGRSGRPGRAAQAAQSPRRSLRRSPRPHRPLVHSQQRAASAV